MKLSRSVSLSMVASLLPVCLRQQLVEAPADGQNFLGVDFEITRLPLKTTQRLMDHDARMRQSITLAHRDRRPAKLHPYWRPGPCTSADIGLDELHGVVNREPAVTEPPGLLMYSEISLSGFSDSRNNSCATIRFAM